MSGGLVEKRERLLETVGRYGRCAVAFSGGVDSAVVAKAAQLALQADAIAVTADSPSLARRELADAIRLADRIGIRHYVMATHEVENPQYTENKFDRCYFCKAELYTRLETWLREFEIDTILNGANFDDLGDHRPGLRAAGEHDVRSPLADCHFSKADVRELAQMWELPVWDKPASPCLSSRIAYGEKVTPRRLEMVENAEQFLRDQGLDEVRVRLHKDDLARIEVPVAEIGALAEPALRAAIVEHFSQLGFRFITLDLAGLRSGSMNAVIPIDSLQRSR